MRAIVVSLVAVVAACKGAETMPDADEALACMTSGRGDTYVAGLEKHGQAGLLDFKLISADPAPPARNFNTWVLEIDAMANGVVGAPQSGATMTVTPYMPDHQHGAGAFTPQVSPAATTGQYQIQQINTWMPGYWEITIDATVGGVEDTVVYKFCIQA